MSSSKLDWTIWIERYRAASELEGLSPKTMYAQKLLLDRLVKWFRDLGIDSPESLTLELLTDYRRHLIQGVNTLGKRNESTTVNRHLIALKRFLEYMKDLGVVPSALPASVKYLKQPKRLPRYTPGHEQVLKVIQTIPGDNPIHLRDRAIVEVLYSTAIRREELANLELIDVNHDNGVVRVNHGKGGKDRVVPIGKVALEWISKYVRSARPALLRLGEEHGKLFVSKSGRALRPDQVTIIVRRWKNRAGVEQRVGPHALRRSCATGMLRNGANLGHIKDILGHESFQSLSVYVELVAADLKEALAKYHPREKGVSL